ncbi:MAG TPA: hypothetical protein VH253_08645 [Phycisphaerae bacterium]|nr:hypothetical protein [Phycisphaerae bacterium]
MKSLSPAAAALAATLLLAPAAGAQSPAPFDPPAFLQQLQDTDSRNAAANRIPSLPAAALAPLLEADASPATPKAVRDILDARLPTLAKTLRADRAKHDQALDDAWTQQQLLTPYKNGPSAGQLLPKIEPALRIIASDKIDYPTLKAAVDAQAAANIKPDDPAIHLAFVIDGLNSRQMPLDHAARQLDPAIAALDASHYSNGVKFILHRWLLSCMLSNNWPSASTIKANIGDETDRVLTLLPAFVAEHPGQERLQRNIIRLARNLMTQLGAEKARLRLSPVLDESLAGNAARDAALALLFEEWGWDARGAGFANTVTDQGWQLFDDRCKKAREFAQTAWREDPLNHAAPDTMIRISMDLQLGDDTMESWFQRAMIADPDDADACDNKAFYLSPQWHGDPTDAVLFGRQCINTGTPRNRISLTIVSVYQNLNGFLDPPNSLYLDPEVWHDLQAAYNVVLSDKSRLLDDRALYLADRSALLNAALLCHQYQPFLDLARQFGNDIDLTALGGKDRYAFYQKNAAKKLAAPH